MKSSLENEKAQYVQYVYDEQGNKVRRFTGMTGPLTVTVAAVENAKDDAGKDTFTYGGKTYAVLVTGKKKSDTIRETKYVYDTKNRLVSYTDPEGRTETYTYDCNSNLTKTVDKNGNTLKNTYDNKNRLTERTAKEKKTGKETVHTYRYNAYGDVAVQDDTQFVYGDVSGQVTKETTKLTKNKDVVKNYTYDSNGNKSTFSVKAGEDTKLSLSYEYDGSSRLISVKDSEGNQAVSYAYDTEGSLSERQAANGLKTTYGYDYQNRLTSMTNETGKGVVSKYSSTYLKNGQKAEEVSTVMDKKGKSTKKTAAYTYDMLGRITRETKTGREDISYTYDANNNRKQMTIGNKTTAYQYNKNDELLRTDTLHTDTEKNDVVIYKNDKNGNQLATVNRSEIPAEAKDTSYIDVDVTLGDNQLNDNVVNHYNALNQLTETLTKNYKVSFTYDAEGLRTGKTVNGEKTVYVWDGDQVVMELSKGGAVQKRYIRGNDLVYADKGENTEKTYYVTDMHGNVVQLLDESGNVTKTYEYDSFGNEVKPEKKDENPYRYCGEYYDKETEEVYLRARYYEPGVGRFITRDTYTGESDEPLSLHLYTYCENDGVNAWDPSGHYKIKMKHINGMKWKKNWKGRKWTKKNISMMNALLKKYGIKKKKSIALMMATCDQESGQGRIMQEEGDDNYCRSHGYTVYTKGAGYIQITGNDQLDFLSYIGVKPKTNRTEQISKKYAWEAACWEWGICQKGGHSMNKYVSDHGKSISVFLITQYYINGWPYSKGDKKYEQFNSDMISLRKKTKKFSYNRKKIVVDNMKYRAPSRWSERSKSYEKAMKVFYGK
ncbi:MAG: RHS repeat domain-containing protein [Clostridium sp.]